MSAELSWRFGIAGVSLDISGPAAWLQPLQQVWCDFPGTRHEIGAQPWSVRFSPDPTLSAPTGPLFEILPRSAGTHCRLEGAGFQGRIAAQEGQAHLRAHPAIQPADVGYFLRVVVALQAFQRQGLLFHTTVVQRRERGYAFFGVSGSGKTTVARLSAPAPVLNDDLVLLWPGERHWQVHATPFGKRRGTAHQVPLFALFRLVQDQAVFLEPLSRSRALAELVANTPVISGDALLLPQLLARWRSLLEQVPLYALHFRRDPSFWEVIDAELG